MVSKGKSRMKPEEIQELMQLMGWTKTKLAAELDLSENAIHRWIEGDRNPSGPAVILMRLWLEAARKKREAVAV